MNRNVIIIAVAVAVVGTAIISATTWNAEDGGQVWSALNTVVESIGLETYEALETNVISGIDVSLNDAGLGKFATFAEYAEFLEGFDELDVDEQSSHIRDEFLRRQAESGRIQVTSSLNPSDAYTHSTTNVHVRGVNEPDFVKNDGRYIYALKHNTLSIVDTQMITESSAFVTTLDIPPLVQEYDMFVNGDRLVVLYYKVHYNQIGRIHDYTTHALILDITDKSAVEHVMEYSVTGKIHTGRMIGDHVYVVSSKVPNIENPIKPVLRLDEEVIQEMSLYYMDGIDQPILNTILALDVNGSSSNSLSIVMDYTGVVFLSKGNMYITSFKDYSDSIISQNLMLKLFEPILELYPEHIKSDLTAELQEIDLKDWDSMGLALERVDATLGQMPERMHGSSKEMSILEQLEIIEDMISTREITPIYKIAVDGIDFELTARGTVLGSVLDRFAMDERDGKLYVSTATDRFGAVFHNVFVLDEKLVEVGVLVGIAYEGQIWTTRFVEDKMYMLTLSEMDPFFVIDLSEDSPKIEGELNLPGRLVYLHFYDKDTIIGIGHDEGTKITIFDISDMKRPHMTGSVIIGPRSDTSPIVSDYRAGLIDRTKSLLVTPVISRDTSITLRTYTTPAADDDETITSSDMIELEQVVEESIIDGLYHGGSLVFMVFDVTRSGLELVHTVSHNVEWDRYREDMRPLYIGDDLYTVSEKAVVKSPLNEPFYTINIPIGPS